MRHTVLGIVVGLMSLWSMGCANYVNIPGQSGDVALHDPNLSTVVEVEVEAIRGMLSELQIEGPFQIILPEQTSASQYKRVRKQLGEHGFGVEVDNSRASSLPRLSVRQIRVRGLRAEVDVTRPSMFRQPDGPQQLATIWLKWEPLVGWQYQRTHLWSIGVVEALSKAHMPRTEPIERSRHRHENPLAASD